jgi:hypothetical protein
MPHQTTPRRRRPGKDVYETCVFEPMAELVAELEPVHGETKIYRPYRDLRFSKD